MKLIVLGITRSIFAFDVFEPIEVNIFVWLIKTAVIRSSNQSQSVILMILSVSDSIITLLHEGTFSRKLRNNNVIDCSLLILFTVFASS